MIGSSALYPELSFVTSRSSGPGGQNVNKVNSRVTLVLDIRQSTILSQEQKEILLAKLHSRLTKDGVLMLTVQDNRSQLRNKEEAMARLDALLSKAFSRKKSRRKTKPSGMAVQKRLKKKKLHGEKKKWRQKV